MRRVSPIDTSVPPSSLMHHVSPTQIPELPKSLVILEEPLPRPTADVAKPVLPPKGEAIADAEPEAFGRAL